MSSMATSVWPLTEPRKPLFWSAPGSRGPRARATLACEDLSLYFQDFSGDLNMTNMAFTSTGHLAVDPVARPVDLAALRTLTEEKHKITLPGDGAPLKSFAEDRAWQRPSHVRGGS